MHFKPSVDFTCVNALVQAVRNGTLLENRSENLDHAFWLGGSVNAYFDSHKDPQVFGSISVPNELEGEDNLLTRLKTELPAVFEEHKPMGATAHGAEKKVEMNPVVASLLKKLIQLALEQLLK